MSSDSEVEPIQPLPYGTPSPYKKCRPAGLSLKKVFSSSKELDTRLKEISKIEEKYMKGIINSIENFEEEMGDYSKVLAHELMVDSLAKLTSQTPGVLTNFVNKYESGDCFKVYFNPNHYFNKFNSESLRPSELLKGHPLYGHLSLHELLELIKLDGLIISQNSLEEMSLISFLLFLGSVTENKTISGRISEVISSSVVCFLDLRAVFENWGKVDQPFAPRSLGVPQTYNFEFVLNTICWSIQYFTLDETKELITLLVQVSLDPLLNGLTSSLLGPLKICFNQLNRFGLEKMEIIDIIYDENLNMHQFLRVTALLLNSGIPEEVGVTYGSKVLHQTLDQNPVEPDSTNMNALHQLLLKAEHKLSKFENETLYLTFLLVELISFKMPNREEFDIQPIINLMELHKPATNSFYFNDINTRFKEMWN